MCQHAKKPTSQSPSWVQVPWVEACGWALHRVSGLRQFGALSWGVEVKQAEGASCNEVPHSEEVTAYVFVKA